MELVWDQTGDRVYETGIDHGVLYMPDNTGVYDNGVAWNGLVSVTESPSGAESSPQYADNIKYLNLVSAEEFGATIEAFTYPPEWGQFDGSAQPEPGITIGQQGRRSFGLSYRTQLGNDVVGTAYGYKLHLIYGAQAAPSERAYTTVNDSPEAATFSWEITTTPVNVGTINSVVYKPTASITIDSTKVDPDALAALTELLYGTGGSDPSLPKPSEVVALFSGTITAVTLTVPSYNAGTHVLTIPGTTGIVYKIGGEVIAAGAMTAMTVGQSKLVTAVPAEGYKFNQPFVDEWLYLY
jgi:hypothetical protein